MSATVVGWQKKTLKSHWLKRPKTVPQKQILGLKINDSKTFIWCLSIDFRFSGRISKPTKITHFTIQIRLKNITHSTNLDSLNIIKNIHSYCNLQHSWKPYSFYKFFSKHVSGWYQVKHLHCTKLVGGGWIISLRWLDIFTL